MSHFPKGGDIEATRAWLDKMGFEGKFVGWKADAILGTDKEYVLSHGGEKAVMLWGFLNAAKGPTGISGDRLLCHLREKLGSDIDMIRNPRILADFGRMADQSNGSFGEVLFGVEGVKKKLATVSDERFASFDSGVKCKEAFKVSALLAGLGTGKSTLLDRHLQILRENCRNEKLQILLAEKSHPLVLNLTFNSDTAFNLAEIKKGADLCLSRRIMAAFFHLYWPDVLNMELQNISPENMVAIVLRQHKALHGLKESDRVAVILNVDDINQIPNFLQGEFSKVLVRDIIVSLRKMSISGINGSPFIPLIAGTGYKHVYESIRGSGAELLVPELSLLTSCEVMEALRGCGVCETYFEDPDFIRLMDETGGVPRLVRIVLEKLTTKFDKSTIEEGRLAALKYLCTKLPTLTLADMHGLLESVLLGKQCRPDTQVSPGSISYDSLQDSGAVWLTPFGDSYRVEMPLLSFAAMCDLHSYDREVRRAQDLLASLVAIDWTTFKEFVGKFHAFKMSRMAIDFSSMSLRKFYGDVDMNDVDAAITIALSNEKTYELKRLTGKGSNFPPVDQQQNKKVALSIFHDLTRGKVILNGQNAAVDCILKDPVFGDVRNGVIDDVENFNLVRAIAISHTIDAVKLNLTKFNDDNEKAIKAFKSYMPFSNDKVVVIHISNREIDVAIPRKQPGCVVIGRENLGQFFGNTLQRRIWSSFFLRNSLKIDSGGGSGASRSLYTSAISINAEKHLGLKRLILMVAKVCK